MYKSEQFLSQRYVLSLLGICFLSLLLLTLPIASYAKSDSSNEINHGLISHLDSFNTQGYFLRIAEIKNQSAEAFFPDIDLPLWAICHSQNQHAKNWGSVCFVFKDITEATPFSRYYLYPPLRAPPLA